MFSRKPKIVEKLAPFSGEVSILMADITKVDALAAQLSPEDLVLFLKDHLQIQISIISEHEGIVIQYVASYINALWRDSDHAKKAVDTARAMLSAADDRINYSIAVATEAAVGAFFGPIKQYQVLGRAMEQADQLLRFPTRPKRSLLVTEKTLTLSAISAGACTRIGLLKEQGDVFSINL